jgi:hypothetical protein
LNHLFSFVSHMGRVHRCPHQMSPLQYKNDSRGSDHWLLDAFSCRKCVVEKLFQETRGGRVEEVVPKYKKKREQ